jgi:hypothetical protein
VFAVTDGFAATDATAVAALAVGSDFESLPHAADATVRIRPVAARKLRIAEA